MCLNCTLLGEYPSFSFLSYPIYKLSPGDENANTDTNTKLRNERPLHSFLKLYLYLYLYICCVCLMHSDHSWVPLFLKVFHFYLLSVIKNTNALILFLMTVNAFVYYTCYGCLGFIGCILVTLNIEYRLSRR